MILRLGGLIGQDRHPIQFLSGREQLVKPNALTNLIHQEDINIFLYKILKGKFRSGVCNFCSPKRETKKKYYTWVADQKKIPLPNYILSDITLDKVVFCNVVKEIGYQFKYESPYDFPI